jgi:hypothetical protein
MKALKFISIIFFLFACNDEGMRTNEIRQTAKKDSSVKPDTLPDNNHNDWQEGFGLIHNPDVDSIWGKPVSYYITNDQCSPLAINFYKGSFRPMDNDSTAQLLFLAAADNDELRPFYRWCLNKTILIQDGALAEYTGVPARKYAEKFPAEFFEYMDYDTTGSKYSDWKNSITYSGFYDEDNYKKPEQIRNRMTRKMLGNCYNCKGQLKQRIRKFTEDCFQ